MIEHRKPMVRIARVVIEALTPLSVSTGTPDGVFDAGVMTDANGLPAIPASSLAGVLRHLWRERYGESATDELFGFQREKDAGKSDVSLSWAVLLDSRQRPVEGLLLGEEGERIENDPILASAAALSDDPVFRNRVRLTHKGAAAHRGKFDRSVVPAGHRFAFEIAMEGGTDEDWNNLLTLLEHPGFRLGGGTRAGLGKLTCRRLHARSFDLQKPEDARAYAQLSVSVGNPSKLEAVALPDKSSAQTDWLWGTLKLNASGLWRIGQGTPDVETQGKPADFLPVTEPRIQWSDVQGTARGAAKGRELLVPASSIKGALAHRFRFHAHRLAGRWANDETSGIENPESPEVDALFGVVAAKDQGQAGCLYLDDVFLDPEEHIRQRVMHNSIDRFTGGVRDRVLFEEESLLGGEFEVPIALDRTRLDRATATDEGLERIRQALALAVQDLLEVRLALGSRTTSGNGFFTGDISGSLAFWLRLSSINEEVECD